MLVDTTTEYGQRVDRRLREERIIWLTTVRADGRPEPSPVWFLWVDETIVIFSEPDTVKTRNIAERPHVALSLNSDAYGADVVIMAGEARFVEGGPAAELFPALVEKYRPNLDNEGSVSTEAFVSGYSVAIQVTPTKLRGY